MKTEDEVRQDAKEILNFENSKEAFSDTGQLTTFNQLGEHLSGHPWKGISDKPDGWYLPKHKADPALILETKAENIKLGDKQIDEIKKNIKIALQYYSDVLGILYNGNEIKYFRNVKSGDMTIVSAQMANELQNKTYYLKAMTDKPIDVQEIYRLTKRINDSLKYDFGIQDLYDRMIFTASALVAKRFGAKLVPGIGYQAMQAVIISTLNKSLEHDLQQNYKLNYLVDVYSKIQMQYPENDDAVDNFIINVTKISESINSSHWRGEDVMAIFFNEFNRYRTKSENGQVFTPDHVTNFMYRLINIHDKDVVFDGTCGSGSFLTKSMANMIQEAGGIDTNRAKKIHKHQLYGIEIDKRIFALAVSNMLIHRDGRSNLNCDDTMSDEAKQWMHDINWDSKGNLKKYHVTKILMNPPYEKKSHPIDILNSVFDNMPKGIDAAVLLPDFKLEKEGKRKVSHLLKHNRLLKIIKMPKETFREGVSVSIFIFKTGESTVGHDFFACEIKKDGLETIKNQGRQDVKNRWPSIEDKWIRIIEHQDLNADKSCKWVTPDIDNQMHLSYPFPIPPVSINDEDFLKTLLDYQMYLEKIDFSQLKDNIVNAVLYHSHLNSDENSIKIEINRSKDHGEK